MALLPKLNAATDAQRAAAEIRQAADALEGQIRQAIRRISRAVQQGGGKAAVAAALGAADAIALKDAAAKARALLLALGAPDESVDV